MSLCWRPRGWGLGGGTRASRYRCRWGAGLGAAEQRIRALHEHGCHAVSFAAGRSATLSRLPASSRGPVRLAGLQLMAVPLFAARLHAAPLHAAPLNAAPFQAASFRAAPFQTVSLTPLTPHSPLGAPLRPLALSNASSLWPFSVGGQDSGFRLARFPLARPGHRDEASVVRTTRSEHQRPLVAGALSTAAARSVAPTPAPAPNELQEAASASSRSGRRGGWWPARRGGLQRLGQRSCGRAAMRWMGPWPQPSP